MGEIVIYEYVYEHFLILDGVNFEELLHYPPKLHYHLYKIKITYQRLYEVRLEKIAAIVKAATESGLGCTHVSNDDFTVPVSEGGRRR